jgi:UDP-4-amino-4,6-dideoxy-N-acetyl-beta-L-altrosamine N-acetyltransferase
MLISGFGVELHLLDETHLETLRGWRNSQFVQQFMQQNVSISAEMQKQWFESLDKSSNYYFLIREGRDFIGCCNIKNITADKSGEGGIFLCDPQYLNGMSASKAIFLMYQWAFSKQIIVSAKSEILPDNKRAIRFNKMLGFTLEKHGDVFHGFLNAANFYSQLQKYTKIISH